MVPADIQERVYKHYRAGNESEHSVACYEAMKAVRKQEGTAGPAPLALDLTTDEQII